jgi:hypothetical protein
LRKANQFAARRVGKATCLAVAQRAKAEESPPSRRALDDRWRHRRKSPSHRALPRRARVNMTALRYASRAPLETQRGRRAFNGCRATQLDTTETCALLQQSSSICPCPRAAGHRVREVACIGIGVPTPIPFRAATQAEFSTTWSLERSVQVLDRYTLN